MFQSFGDLNSNRARGILRPVTSLSATRASISILLCCLGACEPASDPAAESDAGKPVESASKPTQSRFTGTGVVDLAPLLNQTPEQVEIVLGQPTEKGTQRISCVRFVPERVFFACEQEARFYANPKFERIVVEYEDGVATTVQLVGLPGEGEFNPDKALAIAGLALPGNPHASRPPFGLGDTPDQVVQTWDWYNDSARMLVDGQQFRVRVSVVNDDWKRSKIEVINNSPLDEQQRKRIKPSKSAPPDASVSEDPSLAPGK